VNAFVDGLDGEHGVFSAKDVYERRQIEPGGDDVLVRSRGKMTQPMQATPDALIASTRPGMVEQGAISQTSDSNCGWLWCCIAHLMRDFAGVSVG
jgi:hypothetical protein